MIARRGLTVALMLLALGCGDDGGVLRPPVPVRVMVAEPLPISRTVVVPCRLQGADEAVISVATPAMVLEVHVQPGDSVSAGQALVSLESDDALRAGLEASTAAVSAASAVAEYSRNSLERVETLMESGAASSEQLEEAVAAVEAAEADLEAARAAYQDARAGRRSGMVRAPFDGVVTGVPVRAGNPAVGGLVAISGGASFQAELLIPQGRAEELRPGLPVFFETDQFQGRTFQGSVRSVSPAVDPISGLVPARVGFSDTSGTLFAGLDGIASIATVTEDHLPVLPQMALEPMADGGWRVSVVENGRVREREAQAGLQSGFRLQIVSGVEPGDSVVVLGHTLASDGDSVRVVAR